MLDRHAMNDLKLDDLAVPYSVGHRGSLADRVEVLPIATGMLQASRPTV